MLKPSDFYYPLDERLIAQTPAKPRDAAKLMVVDRQQGSLKPMIFKDLVSLLNAEDVLVLNDSKVFPARLMGKKTTGGTVEVLLLRPIGNDTWEAMSRGLKPPQIVHFSHELTGQVVAKDPLSGYIKIKLTYPDSSSPLIDLIQQVGQTPIPPYIHSPLPELTLRQEYQNVYATETGSAAAPTAGMHFTSELLTQLQTKGVQIERVTLHVGPGTFAKLRPEQIAQKTLHHEWYSISSAAAARLNRTKQKGKRIIAVGTTVCRTLESAALEGTLTAAPATTSLFIMPPYQFHFVDALITNFHLPESSLLMLVTAFVSAPNTSASFESFDQSLISQAYRHALQHQYRFFSFGDAMFIC